MPPITNEGIWIENGRIVSDGVPNSNETAHWITVDFDDTDEDLSDTELMEKFTRAIRASECTMGHECEHHFRPYCISLGVCYSHDCQAMGCEVWDRDIVPGSEVLGCRDGILVNLLELAVDIQRRVRRGDVRINREVLFRGM
ncbi:uncharacterized protein N7511_007139 [Penicillium nucicola]|uniref:uncharacterized protein n=1 Tax=Penicillium nucicola TaxID=1850975 RepID=UPI0025457167|nr:uncharacterized protein N7511_007139 [Penicillium nucicola]KAJ5756957.1 hypothetical protein N7511_007139 [Penicillium nucicola]